MKSKTSILVTLLALLFLSGCVSGQQLTFSGREWFVSNHNAEIRDTDSMYRFSLYKELVDSETPLIGRIEFCFLSPAMKEYLQIILKLSQIKNGEILFYAPKYNVLFVALDRNEPHLRPLSASYRLNDSTPITLWLRPWENEILERQQDEMYTNIYRDKGKKLITVVDRFNYGEMPVARISIIQSATKKMKKKFPNHEIAMYWLDINAAESLDAVSYWINGHREASFENFKLGQKKE